MSVIVTFKGGQVFNDSKGNPASIAATGSKREVVSLHLLNNQPDAGTQTPGSFSGHFGRSKFNAIVALVQAKKKNISIVGTHHEHGSCQPIDYNAA